MSAPSDDEYSESTVRAYVTSSETTPSSAEPPPRRWVDAAMALIKRIALVFGFAALVAMLAIFANGLWQNAHLPNAYLQTLQASKPSDRLTANNAPANSPLVPGTKIAAGSVAEPSASATIITTGSVAEPSASATIITTGSVAEPSASAQAQQAPLPSISHPLEQE